METSEKMVSPGLGRQYSIIVTSGVADSRLSPVSSCFVRYICIFLAVKPLIDLAYMFRVSAGDATLGPGHLVGMLVAVWGVGLLLMRYRFRPVLHSIFLAFFLVNLISTLATVIDGVPISFIGVANIQTRIWDSIVFLHVGYLIGIRRRESEGASLLNAMLCGNAIALLINAAAIALGVEAGKNMVGRENGLYYDAGVLANIAVQTFFLAIYLAPLYRGFYRGFLVAIVPLGCIAVIAASASRSGAILLIIGTIIYCTVYQKNSARAAGMTVIAVVFAGIAFAVFDMSTLTERFASDRDALSSAVDDGYGQFSFDRHEGVSLGGLERVGNNRGVVIAQSLDKFICRPTTAILLGALDQRSSHCDYVDVLLRNGLLGLGLYCALLAGAFSTTLRRIIRFPSSPRRLVAACAFTLVSLYIFYALPFRPLVYTTSNWFMWCLVGYVLAWPAGGMTRIATSRLSSTTRVLPSGV